MTIKINIYSGAGLLDCIGWVRRLQNRDPPIAIFFEDVIEDARIRIQSFKQGCQEYSRYLSTVFFDLSSYLR